jgi:helicase required for RNAi-mediated heterochromatin assembly 1
MERVGKRVRWTHSRRLVPGTLVALSTSADNFATICKPAIVVDRSIRGGLECNPPRIQIFWANLEEATIDPNEELVMLESRQSFFESMRHTLVGLQHYVLAETRFDKYLVRGFQTDAVTERVRDNPYMDLTPLVHQTPSDDLKRACILGQYQSCDVLYGFPASMGEHSSLEDSQLQAVQRMLTKELTLIQGPPGTGKTFTSVQALKCLARERILYTQGPQEIIHAQWSHEIIVIAAETNHAVDQMLSHLAATQHKVVRLGGRSQDEEVRKHSLFNLRAKSRSSHNVERIALERSRTKLVEQLQHMAEKASSGDRLLDPHALHDRGIITTEQLGSLVDGKSNWVPTSGKPGGVISEWLNDSLVDVSVRRLADPVFGTEEVDTGDGEFDTTEFEPDMDDPTFDGNHDTRLRGPWVKITRTWGGANPQGYTEENLLMRRQLQKQDLWDIDERFRGAIYEFWWRELHTNTRNRLRTLLADYSAVCREIKINGWKQDAELIRRVSIHFIGCTTTGLSKYRGLLAALKPTTLLIEEAAQSKEASITAALFPSLHRLILVGDHQQLGPHCNIPGLAEHPYNMRVSMFERLVTHRELPYTMLNMQRRAIPTIRELLNPFYPQLQDHPTVTDPENRPAVPGVAAPSYLFHHTWPEATDSESLSKYNLQEAEMIVRFVIHLVLNGVPPHKITVLTFYRGQRKKITRLSSKHPDYSTLADSLNIKTVDSYQGEENDIIILSLVRSNRPGHRYAAGFVEDMCRGVVSISRARCGFYIFGNIMNLENATNMSSFMWGNVRQVFERQGRFNVTHCGIPIRCSNHGTVLYIEDANDFSSTQGGCRSKCEGPFDGCGHVCTRLCHPMSHDKLICQHVCERKLDCGHRCANVCGMDCSCEKQCSKLKPKSPVQTTGSCESRRKISQPLLPPSGVLKGQGQGSAALNDWAKFDATQYDAGVRQASKPQQTPKLSVELVDASKPTADPMSSLNSLLDSYRQVKVNEQGARDLDNEIHTGLVLVNDSTGPEGSTATPSQRDRPISLELVQRQTALITLDKMPKPLHDDAITLSSPSREVVGQGAANLHVTSTGEKALHEMPSGELPVTSHGELQVAKRKRVSVSQSDRNGMPTAFFSDSRKIDGIVARSDTQSHEDQKLLTSPNAIPASEHAHPLREPAADLPHVEHLNDVVGVERGDWESSDEEPKTQTASLVHHPGGNEDDSDYSEDFAF